jgi:hypothetical protein
MSRIKYLEKSSMPEIQIKTKKFGSRIDSYLEMIFLIIVFAIIMPYIFLKTSFLAYSQTYFFIPEVFLILVALMCIYIYFLPLIGKEILRFTGDEFYHKIEVFGIGLPRKYKIYEIKNLEVTSFSFRKPKNPYLFLKMFYFAGFGERGHIHNLLCFDYGKQTKYFGFNLKEPEAREVLQKIKEYIKKGYINP